MRERRFRPAILGGVVAILIGGIAMLAACPRQPADPVIGAASLPRVAAQAAQQPASLVDPVGAPERGSEPGLVRRRQVRIRTEFITPGPDAPATLRFAPFDDVDVQLEFERFDTAGSGPVWVGHAAGQPSGSTMIVVGRDAISGNVRNGAAQWHLRTIAGGAHVVEEMDPAAFPPD
jgi:hypothetical protein